jgi:cell pole-organizing protein PopZ
VTVEPRVEELLATIRKAIDNDISQLDLAQSRHSKAVQSAGQQAARATPARSTNSADEELARLRDRVGRQKIEQRVSVAPPPAPPLRPAERIAPRNDGVSGILSGQQERVQRIPPELLRPSYADDVAPEMAYVPSHYQPVQDAQWVEEAPQPPPQAYYPPAQQAGALMSPQAAYAAQSSFQALADSIVAGMGGEAQLQDVAQHLLRPMLKQWLDDNLPQLVEKLVREEIERVARRGR